MASSPGVNAGASCVAETLAATWNVTVPSPAHCEYAAWSLAGEITTCAHEGWLATRYWTWIPFATASGAHWTSTVIGIEAGGPVGLSGSLGGDARMPGCASAPG